MQDIRRRTSRIASFVILLALVLAAANCGGGDPAPAPTASPQDEAAGIDGPRGAGLFVFGEADERIADSEHIVGSNPLISWRELEPQEGVYNWSALDEALAEATKHGTKIVPRDLTNASLFGQPTPDWFFENGDALSYYPSKEAEAKGFLAPVAWDPEFQRKFGNFLRALGQRYDGNPAIEFFQTNAGGGLYGEIVLTKDSEHFPPGWSPDIQREAITYWIDRWAEAFPRTELSVMVNHVGENIGQDAAAYAVEQGIYLQQNTAWLPPEGIAIFEEYQDDTKIVLEAEDGCRSTDEDDFRHLIETIFAYGFAIDYLHLCGDSLWDESTTSILPSVLNQLRH